MLETKLTGKSPQEAGKGAGKQAQRERGWAAAQARAELTQQKTSKLAKEDVEVEGIGGLTRSRPEHLLRPTLC